MKNFVLPVLFLVASIAPVFASSSIELTPIVDTSVPLQRRVQFVSRTQAGARGVIGYRAPWPISGSCEQATMMIPNTDATAYIRRIRTAFPLDLEDRGFITSWARAYFPPAAEGLTVESVTLDPVKLNAAPTVEVTARYSLFGRSVEHSLLLSRRAGGSDTELVIFELQAQPDDFSDLHRIFFWSLATLAGF